MEPEAEEKSDNLVIVFSNLCRKGQNSEVHSAHPLVPHLSN